MIKLTEREWNSMKRPIFPQIQFVASGNRFQIQSMVQLENEEEYYMTHVMFKDEINEISDLNEFIDEYILKSQDIALKFKIDEETPLLYKINKE